jgi:hypothetical protein
MLGLIFNRLRRDLLGYLNVMKCAEQRERRKPSTRERAPLPPSGAQKHADRVNQQFELQISIAAPLARPLSLSASADPAADDNLGPFLAHWGGSPLIFNSHTRGQTTQPANLRATPQEKRGLKWRCGGLFRRGAPLAIKTAP